MCSPSCGQSASTPFFAFPFFTKFWLFTLWILIQTQSVKSSATSTISPTSSQIAYSPANEWNDGRTSTSGASATVMVDGTSIQIIGGVSPSSGKLTVQLDGQSFSIDANNPSSQTGIVLWSGTGLSTNHVFKVVITQEDTDGKELDIENIVFTVDEGNFQSDFAVTSSFSSFVAAATSFPPSTTTAETTTTTTTSTTTFTTSRETTTSTTSTTTISTTSTTTPPTATTTTSTSSSLSTTTTTFSSSDSTTTTDATTRSSSSLLTTSSSSSFDSDTLTSDGSSSTQFQSPAESQTSTQVQSSAPSSTSTSNVNADPNLNFGGSSSSSSSSSSSPSGSVLNSTSGSSKTSVTKSVILAIVIPVSLFGSLIAGLVIWKIIKARENRLKRRSSFLSWDNTNAEVQPNFPVKFGEEQMDEEKIVGFEQFNPTGRLQTSGSAAPARNQARAFGNRDSAPSRAETESWYSRTSSANFVEPPEAHESTFRRSNSGTWRIPFIGWSMPTLNMPSMPRMSWNMPKFKMPNFGRRQPEVPGDVIPDNRGSITSFEAVPVSSNVDAPRFREFISVPIEDPSPIGPRLTPNPMGGIGGIFISLGETEELDQSVRTRDPRESYYSQVSRTESRVDSNESGSIIDFRGLTTAI